MLHLLRSLGKDYRRYLVQGPTREGCQHAEHDRGGLVLGCLVAGVPARAAGCDCIKVSPTVGKLSGGG